jgi:Xylose isomerase-like TIM barrel
VDLARSRGFEPTFHHHTGTYVEAPWEIERLLELTDIGLLLDTGHLAVGGGDPAQALRDWGERIDHVHVKDVRGDVLEGVIADRADMTEAGGEASSASSEPGTSTWGLSSPSLRRAITRAGSSSSRTGFLGRRKTWPRRARLKHATAIGLPHTPAFEEARCDSR